MAKLSSSQHDDGQGLAAYGSNHPLTRMCIEVVDTAKVCAWIAIIQFNHCGKHSYKNNLQNKVATLMFQITRQDH